ncbi:MAG TPA: hypothetical protein VGH27_19900 [Streptosporangiaceae bacterium]|jgi:hypothetical protein
MRPDDHLGVLMFSGTGTMGRGRYANGQWEVSSAGRAKDAAVRMVSLHEIMHAELNDCTAWGSLFHAYAALVQHGPVPDVYREVSLGVIEACRRTHEAFATYTGAFLADRAIGRTLLTGRPEYLAYYADACQLAGPLPRGSQLEWYLVVSAVRACMQSRGLPEALCIGLDRFRLADLRERDLPDARLRMLVDEHQDLADGIAQDIVAGPYAFLVARSAGTLRSQHAIADEFNLLPAGDDVPVVAIRTPGGTPEAPALRLWQVTGPRELLALKHRVGGMGIVSSVSMSLLADTSWEERWMEPLLECGPVTILMDLNPFAHFEHWASQGARLRYTSIEAGSSTESWIGFACICRDSPDVEFGYERATFLTVCSDTLADALTSVLRKRWPHMAHEDADAVGDRIDLIQVALTHLITEETYFTFTSVPRVRHNKGNTK